MHPWKLAVVVRDDLEGWQRLNVTAFTVSGIGPAQPELIGEPYQDGSGRTYLPMFGLPVLVYAAPAEPLRRAFRRAVDRDLAVALYTDDLFDTDNDIDNRAAVATVGTDGLKLAGFAVAGERRRVDKVLDRLRFHP